MIGTKPGWDGEYLSFEEARLLLISKKFKSQSDWISYCKSGKKPNKIPADLYKIYKNDKRWKGLSHFLNLKNVSYEILSFKEAKSFVRKLNLNTWDDWREYAKSGKPSFLPSNPDKSYKGSGWINMNDFLGNDKASREDFMPFVEARKFVQGLNFKSLAEYKKYIKEEKINLPVAPNLVYKNKGYMGAYDFLGKRPPISNRVKKLNFLSFEEAKKFVRSKNFQKIEEWISFKNSAKYPDFLPKAPNQKYKNDGWKGLTSFLGIK